MWLDVGDCSCNLNVFLLLNDRLSVKSEGPRSIKVPTFHGLQSIMDKFLMGACNHSTLFM
jgi:hypothetical protein